MPLKEDNIRLQFGKSSAACAGFFHFQGQFPSSLKPCLLGHGNLTIQNVPVKSWDGIGFIKRFTQRCSIITLDVIDLYRSGIARMACLVQEAWHEKKTQTDWLEHMPYILTKFTHYFKLPKRSMNHWLFWNLPQKPVQSCQGEELLKLMKSTCFSSPSLAI